MKNAIFAVAGVLAGLAIQAVGMQLTLVAMMYGWDGPLSGGWLFGALTVLLFLLPTGVCAGMAARRYAFLIPALLFLCVGWEWYMGTGLELVAAIRGMGVAPGWAGNAALFLWAALVLAAGIVLGCRASWRWWPKSGVRGAG